MNNQNYQQQVREVDLKELLWKLLMQWKAMLLVSLIMALLLGGAKYVKDNNIYKAEVAERNAALEQASIPAEERIASIMDALPNEDVEAIEMVLNEKDWLDDQKLYIDESVLMKVDPTNCRTLRLIYDIEVEDPKDISVILQDYEVFINGDGYREAIGEIIDPEKDRKYIGELISTTSKEYHYNDTGQTGAVLTINIVLPEEIDTNEIVDASNTALAGFASSIQSKYKHTIDVTGTDVKHDYNYDVVNRHYDNFNKINGMTAVLANAENALTPEQKIAYEAIKTIQSESAEIKAPEAELVAPALSKKYIMLGFVLGAFIYAGIYLAILILRGNIISASSVQRYTGIRVLGEVCYNDEYVGVEKLLHSRAIGKIKNREKADQSQQIEKITESLEAVCEHAGAKKLDLLDLTDKTDKGKNDTIIGSLLESAKEKNLNLEIVNSGVEIDEKKLIDIDNAVLIVSEDTKANNLGQAMSLSRDYDINVLGTVYIAKM